MEMQDIKSTRIYQMFEVNGLSDEVLQHLRDDEAAG